MEKIVAAFDGLKYSEGTREYALMLAKEANAHLVGVFLDDLSYTGYKIYEVAAKGGITEEEVKKLDEVDRAARHAATSDFERSCQQAGLEFTIHHDKKIAIKELLHESVFADLLIIDARETLTHYPEKQPTRFIRDLLEDVQCPVLVVPHHYKKIEKVKLLYDGGASSVHAIKMFSYLLPQLKDLDTEVISINPPGGSSHVPDTRLMKELMKRHFPAAHYTVASGWPEEEIVNQLDESDKNVLVVLGAYRRGAISRWLRESLADTLMTELDLPLFISHS